MYSVFTVGFDAGADGTMIPVPVVVCVMGGWCTVYLMDTMLRVKSESQFASYEQSSALRRALMLFF